MQLLASDIAGERGGNTLFSGVGFALSSGAGLVLTGPNGAGKSTLLRILAGLLRPAAGTVGLIDDAGNPAHDAMHFLSANNAMKDALTCRENLLFWKNVLPAYKGGSGLAPLDALAALQLPHVAELPFGYLSTGQRRRVAIARLLVSHRPLWLVDEPTSGLDQASEALFADIAAAHLKSGGILVAATHLPLAIDGLRQLAIGGAA